MRTIKNFRQSIDISFLIHQFSRFYTSSAYFPSICEYYSRKDGAIMDKTKESNNMKNIYDDDNIPEVDLPKSINQVEPTEPLPESTRPRKDGPGGEDGK